MNMQQYAEVFIEESKENLQGLNTILLKLEQDPHDAGLVNDIFRIAHTLKGMSATMGYNKMAKLTHVMEDTLDTIRNGKRKVDDNLVDLLFRCLDALEKYILNISDEGNEGEEDNQSLIDEFKNEGKTGSSSPKSVAKEKKSTSKETARNVVKGGEGFPDLVIDNYSIGAIKEAEAQNRKILRVDLSLDRACLLKSVRAFMFFKLLDKHGEVLVSNPTTQDIEDEKFDRDISVILISKSDQEVVEQELNKLSEVSRFKVEEVSQEFLAGVSNAPSSNEGENEEQKASVNNGEQQVRPKGKQGKTVRVDIERLDVLMNLVSELIISKTRLEGIQTLDIDKGYVESLEYIQRITTSLHDAVMKARMVSVESVFNRFPRMIRDVAKEINKQISLIMSGEDTELDRTIIDEIGEPLIHLLRNSADHGLEPLDVRRKAGKPDTGHIYLRAYQAGNNVVIEVEDDGRGIDTERVKKKAMERGLIGQENVASLSERDIIGFLFHPGFSTAETVSDLSGRGVGLDAVKTKIETLGGIIEVENNPGKGSKFSIKLPMTLAIMHSLIIEVANEKYALQLNGLSEIIKIKPKDIDAAQGKEVFILRNNIIPLVWLGKVLEVPEMSKELPKELMVVIAKKGDRSIGIVVDQLLGQREIVIKSLGGLFTDIKCIAGATILGDGDVALIIDINYLV